MGGDSGNIQAWPPANRLSIDDSILNLEKLGEISRCVDGRYESAVGVDQDVEYSRVQAQVARDLAQLLAAAPKDELA